MTRSSLLHLAIDLLADGVEHGADQVRERALAHLRKPRAGPPRDVDQRRRYAERRDACGYMRDILGFARFSPQQEQAIELIIREDRVLLPSANNTGKTFGLAGVGLYFFDAVASLLENGKEIGCQLLLPGPDHTTIRDTIYATMLEHAVRAEARGFGMPGERSENSVSWRVGPKWFMRAFAPAKDKRRNVAHTASGRHAPNQIALVEEGQGVDETVWRAVEGMCSGEHPIVGRNKIISAFNPTEASGAVWERARRGRYRVFHMSALEHPNIAERAPVIAGAISLREFEERLRTECDDRGPFPGTTPDPDFHDFIYALPPAGAAEPQPRQDGLRGHRKGKPHVYRPGPVFVAQGLGQWPRSGMAGLFDPGAWDRAVERWRAGQDPDSPPDRVGVDVAREGADDTCAAPAWGRAAPELLEAWSAAHRILEGPTAGEDAPADEDGGRLERALAELRERLGDVVPEADLRRMAEGKPAGIEFVGGPGAALTPERLAARRTGAAALLEVMRQHSRVRVGRLVVAPKGDGPSVARFLAQSFPDSPFVLDQGSVGASPYDHLGKVLDRQVAGINFAGKPLPLVHGEQLPLNFRAQMYLRAAALVRLGLVDVPDDPMLREELFAPAVQYVERVLKVGGRREMRMVARIESKDSVKARLGRSPDRADAFVLALTPLAGRRWEVW